jgi:hypothetical protein
MSFKSVGFVANYVEALDSRSANSENVAAAGSVYRCERGCSWVSLSVWTCLKLGQSIGVNVAAARSVYRCERSCSWVSLSVWTSRTKTETKANQVDPNLSESNQSKSNEKHCRRTEISLCSRKLFNWSKYSLILCKAKVPRCVPLARQLLFLRVLNALWKMRLPVFSNFKITERISRKLGTAGGGGVTLKAIEWIS